MHCVACSKLHRFYCSEKCYQAAHKKCKDDAHILEPIHKPKFAYATCNAILSDCKMGKAKYHCRVCIVTLCRQCMLQLHGDELVRADHSKHWMDAEDLEDPTYRPLAPAPASPTCTAPSPSTAPSQSAMSIRCSLHSSQRPSAAPLLC